MQQQLQVQRQQHDRWRRLHNHTAYMEQQEQQQEQQPTTTDDDEALPTHAENNIAAVSTAAATAVAPAEDDGAAAAVAAAFADRVVLHGPVRLWELQLDRQLTMLRDGDLASLGFNVQSPPQEQQ